MAADSRKQWLGQVLSAGLEHRVVKPSDVVTHANPQVLAQHLPPQAMAKVLQSALTTGSMTAEGILDAVGVDGLRDNVPGEVLWKLVSSAAARAGLTKATDQVQDSPSRRAFLTASLAAALELRVITPDRVIKHTTPELLATHLPVKVRANLLEKALAAKGMTPELIIDTVTPRTIAENLPMHVVWGCLATEGTRQPKSSSSSGSRPPQRPVPKRGSSSRGSSSSSSTSPSPDRTRRPSQGGSSSKRA